MKASVLTMAAVLAVAAFPAHAAGNGRTPGPVIDMHVHAWPLEAPPAAGTPQECLAHDRC